MVFCWYPICSSKGFFDFTSSGHENGLAFAMLLVIHAAYHGIKTQDNKTTGQEDYERTGPGTPTSPGPCSLWSRRPILPPPAAALSDRLADWSRAVNPARFVAAVRAAVCLAVVARTPSLAPQVDLIALAGLPLLRWTIASLVYSACPIPTWPMQTPITA